MVVEKDPGTQGPKLSKSGTGDLDARNKSYEKVLDLQIAWIRIRGEGKFDGEEEAYTKWRSKSAWHEKEFGW